MVPVEFRTFRHSAPAPAKTRGGDPGGRSRAPDPAPRKSQVAACRCGAPLTEVHTRHTELVPSDASMHALNLICTHRLLWATHRYLSHDTHCDIITVTVNVTVTVTITVTVTVTVTNRQTHPGHQGHHDVDR